MEGQTSFLSKEERKEMNKKMRNFSKNYGNPAFFKVAFSALCHLLVDQGITTERDIYNHMTKEVESFIKKSLKDIM